MNDKPKTMFGWDMEKNLDDFLPISNGLQRAGHHSKADAVLYLIERCKIAEAERNEYRASRIGYASEFPMDADGCPDVGNIHANIRKLKEERDAAVKYVAEVNDKRNQAVARAEVAEAKLEEGRQLAKRSYDAACDFKEKLDRAEAKVKELEAILNDPSYELL